MWGSGQYFIPKAYYKGGEIEGDHYLPSGEVFNKVWDIYEGFSNADSSLITHWEYYEEDESFDDTGKFIRGGSVPLGRITNCNMDPNKENTDYGATTTKIKGVAVDSRTEDVTQYACNHSWKKYQGIMYRYEYCEHCDEKRDHA